MEPFPFRVLVNELFKCDVLTFIKFVGIYILSFSAYFM